MRMTKWLAFLLLPMIFVACEEENPNFQQEAANPAYLRQCVDRLTDVIVHDIFSPPVASRIYAYASISAYEALVPGAPQYQSLAGQLTDLEPLPAPLPDAVYCYPLAAVTAYLKVGKALIFSEDSISVFQDKMRQEFAAIHMPKDVEERSVAYGEAIADAILAWSSKDNYKQTRTFPKYSITDNPAEWQPTPPSYMDGIEPSWNKIRPFVLDSAQQFIPLPPTPFSPEKDSEFYQDVLDVYGVLAENREEKVAIAEFWDCNPYVSHTTGHVMFATKKITPGGHWMGIAGQAATKAKADITKTAATYALTSIALADGFISCWDEKYRSRLLRPETFINRYLDENWQPLLQTPPFPEYTSGHSVISRAAAIALTSLYGDNFAFADSVEVAYGLPVRSFNSFLEASSEAAVSRLYGGIHYRPACDNGVAQGEQVGKYVVAQVALTH
ncbi:MAG: phosphatidic acid phosphatase [Bacteroidetes bacterium]|nr:MAG: phosphatidic acid phosphatase [Bacteroidota bacterium]